MTKDKTVTMSRELAERCFKLAALATDFETSEKLRALLAAPVVERHRLALSIPDECPHLIVFDDAERETLMFSGAGARSAALKTWEQISMSWNAHLFVRVERNSRDDRYPSASTSPPAPVAVASADFSETQISALAQCIYEEMGSPSSWLLRDEDLKKCLDKVKELNQ